MNIVKVRYISETTQERSAREYSYLSEVPLRVGDIITVPVRDTTATAEVSAIDVPDSEVAGFRSRLKTIVSITPEEPEPERELAAEVDFGPTALIKVGPEHNPAVIALSEEAVRIRDYAFARVIMSDLDLAPATEDLSIIAKLKRALAEKKVEYLTPIRRHMEAINATFATILGPLEEADTLTRNKIKTFRAEVERRRLEAEEINRQKQELARREAAFSGTGEVTIDTTPVEVPAAIGRITTGLGTSSTMKVKKWELVNFAAVPDEFKMLDSAKVTRLVKAGGTIPGIKTWEEDTIRVTTR